MWIVAWNVSGEDRFAIYEGFGAAKSHYRETLRVPGLVSAFIGPVVYSSGFMPKVYPAAGLGPDHDGDNQEGDDG